MSIWLIVGAVIVYLGIGAGIARIWAELNRRRWVWQWEDLKIEMGFLFVLWPVMVPLWLLAQLIRLVLFPGGLR